MYSTSERSQLAVSSTAIQNSAPFTEDHSNKNCSLPVKIILIGIHVRLAWTLKQKEGICFGQQKEKSRQIIKDGDGFLSCY